MTGYRKRIKSVNKKSEKWQELLRSKDANDRIEIHLVKGENSDGIPTYVYLALYASQARDMELSLMTKTTDLEQYGVVLASGEGKPSAEVKAYVDSMLA